MSTIANNWYIIVGIICVVMVALVYALRFINMPSDQQLIIIRKWLLYAVTQAEAQLGGKTGKLKLATVYDMFVKAFPQFAKVIPYEVFSKLVDDALDEMREMIETNDKIKELVEND